jgi:hypothetical protein
MTDISITPFYRDSRGYSWYDMVQMRTSPRPASTEVPDCFKHQFADRAAYDAWVEEKRRDYFG